MSRWVCAKLFTSNSCASRQDKSYCDTEMYGPSSLHYISSGMKIPSYQNIVFVVQGDVMNINRIQALFA